MKKYQKKLGSKVCNSDITPSSRFLLPEKLLSSYTVLFFSFYFTQFLSNFLKYSFSKFPSSHLYNILTIYFFGNFPLLKSFSSIVSSFFYLLTPVFILFSNSATTFFMFSKSSSFFQLLCSTVNPFHYTKYLITPLIFLLFKIFSTFHFSTSFTFTGFASFTFYSPICFLYHTIQLTFITGWILIEVSNHNLTILVDITFSILYGPTY